MKKIGIVTVTFNSEDVLPGFFKCLSAQDQQGFVLYLIDNLSTDGSAEAAERLCRETGVPCCIVRNEENVGIARANNQGIRMALDDGCDLVLISNNDIEFQTDTFGILRRIEQENPGAIIAPKVVFHDTPDLVWYAGGKVSKLRGVPRTRGYQKPDLPEYGLREWTRYASTCFLLVPSEVFSSVGLMDEDYFVYADDADFVARCLERGNRLLYVPTPRILHKVSVSTGGADSPFTIYQITKNTILYLHKNNRLPLAVWYILVFYLRSCLKIPGYNRGQRAKVYAGLKEGSRFMLSHLANKHNIPAT